jgi:nucleoid-associated protein YgaU
MKSRTGPPTLMPAVALAVLGAVVAIPTLSTSRLYAAPPSRYAVVTVHRGDSLWDIAERVTKRGESVQDTVDTIASVNHIVDGDLSPGQRLRIPR